MANENGIGRPNAQQKATAAAENNRERVNTAVEAMGDGWPLLISIFRWWPDFLLDILRDDEADYELSIIQRIILRANARHKRCDIQGSRSLTKSFCELILLYVEGVLWPGLKTAYFGPSQKQTATIALEKYAIISKNYPILTSHYDVTFSKDSFEAKTAYNSVFSITARRGNDFHQTVAEEYAQEEQPQFDHDEYAAVVKKSMRGFPMFRGRKDRTFVPYKQRSITSAGRRQNRAFEIRSNHYDMMCRGEDAFVIDVPYDVILLTLMRDVDWAETQKEDCTPELWAREMETRNTGTDQNPVVRDEVLSASRSLLLMEEHHCCRDRDNKLRPEDVIYVVAYDVSYADGAQNAKCAAAVIKLTKQAGFLKRDKYLKQIVWLQDWRPTDHMLQAKRLKELWAKFTYEGSQTYIAIDAWQYGTAVLTDLMGDLQDGLAPLCVYKHKSFTEFEMEGAVPIIYPIRAGGNGVTDPDAEMLRYAMVQYENNNVEMLTTDFEQALTAYKTYHRIRNDQHDGDIYMPYRETGKLVGQIQNLKAVPSGTGMSEKRISNRTQRDYWSAVKYGMRVAQILETEYLQKPKQKSSWDVYAKKKLASGTTAAQITGAKMRGVGRQGGRRLI